MELGEKEGFAAAHSHLERGGAKRSGWVSCAAALPLAWLLGDDR